MNASSKEIDYIESVDINDHLVYFYWGRHPDHSAMDMRLGGGTYAIYKDRSAIVVDTMNLPGQGKWVKQHLQEKYGINNFTVVVTHWHLDHITENHLYKNNSIIGHADTRKIILANQDTIEAGTLWGPRPFRPCHPTLPSRIEWICGWKT